MPKLERMAKALEVKKYHEREIIVEEGDMATDFFIIK